MTRIAIVAPALALRAGLRALISAGEGWAIASEAASLAEQRQIGQPADLLLISGEAFDEGALRDLLAVDEGRMGVLVLCDTPEIAARLRGLPLHGWGVLPLDASAEELHAGLRAVAEGLVVAAPALITPLMARPLSAETAFSDTVESLTERETQVLELLAQGLANKQIARSLGISEHTVKFHVSAIYAKLGATNRTEAVRTGVQRGLVLL